MFQQHSQATRDDASRRFAAIERAALMAQIEYSSEVLEQELVRRRENAQAVTPGAVAPAMFEFVAATACILLALAAMGVFL